MAPSTVVLLNTPLILLPILLMPKDSARLQAFLGTAEARADGDGVSGEVEGRRHQPARSQAPGRRLGSFQQVSEVLSTRARGQVPARTRGARVPPYLVAVAEHGREDALQERQDVLVGLKEAAHAPQLDHGAVRTGGH